MPADNTQHQQVFSHLQTFPDDFEFIGSKESVRKQIGMAVPPQGSKVVMEAVLKTFAGIDYPSVAPTAKLQLENLQKGDGRALKGMVD